ncbi:MAG: FtsQ-type POTRA domain-containing protein [Bacillota bacterium]
MAYIVRHTSKSRIVQTTLIVILLCISLFLFIQSNFFNCQRVIITGNHWLHEDYLIKVADVSMGSNLFYIDVSVVKQKLELIPMVESVIIQKRLPHTLYITIVERTPALLLVASGKFILVDKQGVFIRDVESIRDFMDLPIVTGLDIKQDIAPGELLQDAKMILALTLQKKIWEEYGEYFNEIDLSLGINNVVMYTREGITVKIGSIDNIDEKMSLFKKIYLDKLQEGNLALLDYLDISFSGLPVIKYK